MTPKSIFFFGQLEHLEFWKYFCESITSGIPGIVPMGAGDFHLPSSQHGDPTKRNRLISPPNGPKRLVYPLLLKGIAILQKTLIQNPTYFFWYMSEESPRYWCTNVELIFRFVTPMGYLQYQPMTPLGSCAARNSCCLSSRPVARALNGPFGLMMDGPSHQSRVIFFDF